MNLNQLKEIGNQTAEKYLNHLEKGRIQAGEEPLPEHFRAFVLSTFFAGFSSGVRWMVTGDTRTPPERNGTQNPPSA